MNAMEILGYLLIIGALAGAGVLMYLCFRQKPETEVTPARTAVIVPKPEPMPAPVPEVVNVRPGTWRDSFPPPEPEPLPTAKDQHTIYTFARETQVCVCPCCDGENNIYRDRCCICGFEFRRGGWSR